jgi:hypothetical protein
MMVCSGRHRLALQANRLKQTVHFTMLIPAIFVGATIAYKGFRHGITAPKLVGHVWHNAPPLVRAALFAVVVIATAAVLGFLLVATLIPDRAEQEARKAC